MIDYAARDMPDDDYYYHRSRTWNFVPPEIKACTEPEPDLVRANPGEWPEVYVPRIWPEEYRQRWIARWKELNA